jgi:hypothetical protein
VGGRGRGVREYWFRDLFAGTTTPFTGWLLWGPGLYINNSTLEHIELVLKKNAASSRVLYYIDIISCFLLQREARGSVTFKIVPSYRNAPPPCEVRKLPSRFIHIYARPSDLYPFLAKPSLSPSPTSSSSSFTTSPE